MEFFAVTLTSIYSVSDKRDKAGIPIVRKIALKGRSKLKIRERIKGGNLVGVTRKGIMLYYEDHPKKNATQPPEMVNTAFQGGHTSPIVGLFLDKEQATACFDSGGPEECDRRWRKQTEEVLKAIGDNHNTFIISKWQDWAFKY